MSTNIQRKSVLEQRVERAVHNACQIIAPTWPLDRSIAVNPYWGWRGVPFSEVAKELSRLAGYPCYMGKDYYMSLVRDGVIAEADIRAALIEFGEDPSVAKFLRGKEEEKPRSTLPLFSDVVDEENRSHNRMTWCEVILTQISQFCASNFDRWQADWKPHYEGGLYAAWLHALHKDRSVPLLMGMPQVIQRAKELPTNARDLLSLVSEEFLPHFTSLDDIFRGYLLRINGWASWCAYQKWIAQLQNGAEDTHLEELLAIRIAWDYLLYDGKVWEGTTWHRWTLQLEQFQLRDHRREARELIFLRAHEISYQREMVSRLKQVRMMRDMNTPHYQLAFCIDVRSEPMRRALEEQTESIRTLGFAGFFGLPIEYAPLGTATSRPQLPGLLAPQLRVTDTTGDDEEDRHVIKRREAAFERSTHLEEYHRLPASSFTRVELLGLMALPKLLAGDLLTKGKWSAPDTFGLSSADSTLRPKLEIIGNRMKREAELAATILRAMSLTEGFAPLVALIGHGSQSANNPLSASLDCGACCGQSGEINARTISLILNNPVVREELVNYNIHIPSETLFLAGIHNTTTDEITFFRDIELSRKQEISLQELEGHVVEAGKRVRAERSERFGTVQQSATSDKKVFRSFLRRSHDWAETRPEWGLVNNAAFIIARRERTRNLSLDGRVFLHEYRAECDEHGKVLELLMTAPMIVTHWINMQYYASTVDPEHFGSGNKVLQNVVGGSIGVFEGNGGDLRIGLSKQSLHDGKKWVHEPLRLSVFIEAPAEAIREVFANHPEVEQLVRNKWLYLFRLGEAPQVIEQYNEGNWVAV